MAASLDNREDSAKTQEKFPHLIVVSDAERKLAGAAGVIGPHHSPYGGDAAAPTTMLIDRQRQVRWVFRPDHYIVRLSADELLAAVDEHRRTPGD